MDAVGSRVAARLASVGFLLSLAPAACTDAIDPCVPVELLPDRFDRSEELAAGFPLIDEQAPLAAISAKTADGEDESLVIYPGCHPDQPCGLIGEWLQLSGGSQVVITGDGSWVVAIDQATADWRAWRLPPAELDGSRRQLETWTKTPEMEPHRIIAALRHQDRLLVRKRDLDSTAGTSNSRLKGELFIVTPGLATVDRFDDPEATRRMTVLAFGHSFVVLGSTGVRADDMVYLGVIGPPGAGAHLTQLHAIPNLERVFVAPDDTAIAITSLDAGQTTTAVFEVPSGQLIDRFEGSPISMNNAGDELPGLSAFSPNGDYLAYRTPEGDLAQRDSQAQTSCLAHLGDHRSAGYSASGVLFADFFEGQSARRRGVSRVVAIDLRAERKDASERMRRLANFPDPSNDFRLAGAPQLDFLSSDAESIPWAVGVSDGRYYLLQPEGEAYELRQGLANPDPLELLRRDSPSLHLLRSFVRERQDGTFPRTWKERIVAVNRVIPRLDPDDPRRLSFEEVRDELSITPRSWRLDVADDLQRNPQALEVSADSHGSPEDEGLDPGEEVAFVFDTTADDLLCVSLGALGSWGYRCRPAHQPEFFEGSDRPGSELWKNRRPGPLEEEGFDNELPPKIDPAATGF